MKTHSFNIPDSRKNNRDVEREIFTANLKFEQEKRMKQMEQEKPRKKFLGLGEFYGI